MRFSHGAKRRKPLLRMGIPQHHNVLHGVIANIVLLAVLREELVLGFVGALARAVQAGPILRQLLGRGQGLGSLALATGD